MNADNPGASRLALLIAGGFVEGVRVSPSGDLWARCPFHKEETVAFHISPAKLLFKCFGCGISGRVCRFLELTRGVEAEEAARILKDLIQLAAFTPSAGRNRPRRAGELLGGLFESYALRLRSGAKSLTTGFERLDALSGGLSPGELTVLAARSGVGRTSFGIALLLHVGLKLGRPVAYVSGPLAPPQATERLLGALAGFHPRNLPTELLGGGERRALREASERLAKAPIYLPLEAPRSLNSLGDLTRSLRREQGVEFFVYDGIEHLAPQASLSVGAGLRDLARDLDLHLLATSRLKTRGQTQVHDLPADLFSNASSVLLLSQSEVAASERGFRRLCLEVAKSKAGPLGSLSLALNLDSLTLSEPGV
ncbi:MAG: hypothetical protein JKY65_18175 [Planctomycetes bacterium]|nr:hypothetical protein [Planctomycetota bacterium]